MQIKFLSLGLLATAAASVVLASVDTVRVADTNINTRNTGSCVLNRLKVKNVLNNLHVGVGSERRSVLPRKNVARRLRHSHNYGHHSESEPDEEEEDEDEPDEEEEDEDEPDEEEDDENEPDEDEPDEDEPDEDKIDESSFSKAMRRREWEDDEDEADEQEDTELSKRAVTRGLFDDALDAGSLLGSNDELLGGFA